MKTYKYRKLLLGFLALLFVFVNVDMKIAFASSLYISGYTEKCDQPEEEGVITKLSIKGNKITLKGNIRHTIGNGNMYEKKAFFKISNNCLYYHVKTNGSKLSLSKKKCRTKAKKLKFDRFDAIIQNGVNEINQILLMY